MKRRWWRICTAVFTAAAISVSSIPVLAAEANDQVMETVGEAEVNLEEELDLESDLPSNPESMGSEEDLPQIAENAESEEGVDIENVEESMEEEVKEEDVSKKTSQSVWTIGKQVKAKASLSEKEGKRILTFTISGSGGTYNYKEKGYKENPMFSYMKKINPDEVHIQVKEGITRLGNYLFYKMESLTEFQLADSVKKLGKYTFAGTGITELNLPKTLKKMGWGAFSRCGQLTKVFSTGGVEVLPGYCFSFNPKLVEVTLTDGDALKIKTSCFYSCENLEAVHIPPSVWYLYGFEDDEVGEYATIFGYSPKAVIYGMTNTEAESYAKEWGYDFVSTGEFEGDTILLDEAHFPDEYFRQCVAKFDTDQDGILNLYDLYRRSGLTLEDARIQDLTGIEYFRNLTYLELCGQSDQEKMVLKNADLSKCRHIKTIILKWCSLEKLDFGDTPTLRKLNISDCDIKEQTLECVTGIRYLYMMRVNWETMELSKLKKLKKLFLYVVPIQEISLENNTKLKKLELVGTGISSIDLAQQKNLTKLEISNCTVPKLDLTPCKKLRFAVFIFTDYKELKKGKDQKNLEILTMKRKYTLYMGSNKKIPIERLDGFGALCKRCYISYKLEGLDFVHKRAEIVGLTPGSFEGDRKECSITVRLGGGQYVKVPVTVLRATDNLSRPKLQTISCSKEGNVQITWKKVKGADGYAIYRKAEGGKWKRIQTLDGKPTSYLDCDNKLAGIYYYTVRAIKYVGGAAVLSKYNSRGLPVEVYPIATTEFKKITAGKGTVTLTWTRYRLNDGYVIYRSTSKGGPYEAIATLKKWTHKTYTDTNLKSRKTYYYKIRLFRNTKEKRKWGPYSKVKSVKVK